MKRFSVRPYRKGVDNLSPPFSKFGISASHFGNVILELKGVGKDAYHVPLFVSVALVNKKGTN